ncbi:MlaD family protein [Nocardia callitridis]|uniref:MCE family protein n=1 Tax=Nocardia callitridis TaxID=648753 RepID=A0ABP9KCF9_9NOCA
MPISFESDGKYVSDTRLAWRGLVFVIAAALVAAAMIARSEGAFEDAVSVTADLTDVGDGLPAKSDVKFHGLLVGRVETVTPGTSDSPNQVLLALDPAYASTIPATVTARVVPSNVFAVPSIQLVDNGSGPALAGGARIAEDHGAETVQLQTSLTALSRIADAAGRSGNDPTVGILTTIEQATSGRGDAARAAVGQLERIEAALRGVMATDDTTETLAALSDALAGVHSATPDLLDALHSSVVPMRAVAERRTQLTALLGGAVTTTGTVAGALERRTDSMLEVTGHLGPALDVLAEGGRNFVQMTTSQRNVSAKFATEFWNAETGNGTAKIILELTPHEQYTRADCPRYGALAGPSCASAPLGGPSVLSRPGEAIPAAARVGGVVGGRDEQERLASVLGGAPNPLSDLLVGPLFRGNDVRVAPAEPDRERGGR